MNTKPPTPLGDTSKLRAKVINAVCFKKGIIGHLEQFEVIEALITAQLKAQLDRLEARKTKLCDNSSSDMVPTFIEAIPLSAITKEREQLHE